MAPMYCLQRKEGRVRSMFSETIFVKIYKISESLDIRQVLEACEKEELEPITF